MTGELPACIRMTIYDGRGASMHDQSSCESKTYNHPMYVVCANKVRHFERSVRHPNMLIPCFWPLVDKHFVRLKTASESEALVAYERGCEWVRTGELD